MPLEHSVFRPFYKPPFNGSAFIAPRILISKGMIYLKNLLRPRQTKNREGEGFVFATTGLQYTNLARRAARSLKLAMPKAQIDLFTDQKIEDPIFDEIHPVTHRGPRPKMEALLSSRFEKTIYLDADVVVVEDISDVFDLLDTHPIAAALGVSRSRTEMTSYRKDIPHAFPVLNSGVFAIRRTPQTLAFLEDWDRNYARSKIGKDQPVLRATLYEHQLMPLVLPPEYNLLKQSLLDKWGRINGGIRCLHVRALHDVAHPNTDEPIGLQEVVRPRHLQTMIKAREADHSLKGSSRIYDLPPARQRVKPNKTARIKL